MSEMQKIRVTINAKAIAEGVVGMIREADPESETLIRFGMLPKTWMDMIERQMVSVIQSRFDLAGDVKDKDKFFALVRNPNDAEDLDCVGFSMKKLIAEMVHEVSLAMYGAVDMVV